MIHGKVDAVGHDGVGKVAACKEAVLAGCLVLIKLGLQHTGLSILCLFVTELTDSMIVLARPPGRTESAESGVSMKYCGEVMAWYTVASSSPALAISGG